jgi:teichuronic acid biosynthesis glycosyltransferase TuaH
MAHTLDTPATTVVDGSTGGDWAGLIVLCAANSWDAVKLADRHMAERLTAHAPVLYVDPPISHLTRFKNPAVAASVRRPHLRTVAPRLARYTPVVAPKPTHPAMIPLTTRLLRRQLRGAVRRLGGQVHAVIATDVFLDVYGACDEQHRVYWWQDDPVAGAVYWGADVDRLKQAEERLANASDLIVAVNEIAVTRWEERGLRAAHLPNGCDASSFADVDRSAAPPDVDLEGPVAGFVGHINSRTDLGLLEAVADAGVSVMLVGPKEPSFEPERFDRLVERRNVAYVGSRPFEQLPSYLKLIDVGLVPYGMTDFNRYSFPMKTLEYLAAGRSVVATSLPAMQWLDTDLVSLADNPEAFAASVKREVALAGDPERIRRCRQFVSGHTWAKRAEQFAELLELPA